MENLYFVSNEYIFNFLYLQNLAKYVILLKLDKISLVVIFEYCSSKEVSCSPPRCTFSVSSLKCVTYPTLRDR